MYVLMHVARRRVIYEQMSYVQYVARRSDGEEHISYVGSQEQSYMYK
jgi:hypothetical protein